MTGKVLLDTNIIVAIFATEQAVLDKLSESEEVYVPAVALGELYYGARKSGRTRSNLARIDAFANEANVLGTDIETARTYGRIKNRLRAKGSPIPENDIWIAAVALRHGLTLVSRDEHYARVDGLMIKAW